MTDARGHGDLGIGTAAIVAIGAAAVVVIGVVAFVLVARGDDSEASPAEPWANDVCTRVSKWRREAVDIRGATRELSRNGVSGGSARRALQTQAEQVESATGQLVDELRVLGLPGTRASREGGETIERLAGQLDGSREELHLLYDELSSDKGIVATARTVLQIGREINDALSDTARARQELESSEAGAEVSQAFDEAPACKALRSDG